MKKSLNESEIKLLQKIHTLALGLEKIPMSQSFPEDKLLALNFLLGQFALSENRGLQKLSKIPDHLFPQMDKRQFSHFIVPIERLLDRALRDDHFLVQHQDRDSNAAISGTNPLISEGAQQNRSQSRPLIFILDHLRSAFNVGSIFRLADGFAVREIHLLGYTPGPENPYVKKTALGTHDFVYSQSYDSWAESFKYLRHLDYQIVALETALKATPLTQASLQGSHAFVVGNERFGLPLEILNAVDSVVQIPMKGYKNSLNIANALSIATFEWERQNLEVHDGNRNQKQNHHES